MWMCVVLTVVVKTVVGLGLFEVNHEQSELLDELLHPALNQYPLEEVKERYTRSIDNEIENEMELAECCQRYKTMKAACCGSIGVFNQTMAFQKVINGCNKLVTAKQLKNICDNQEQHLKNPTNTKIQMIEKNICVWECLLQSVGVTKEDGSLQEDALKVYMTENLITEKDNWDEGVVEKAHKLCYECAKKRGCHALSTNGRKWACSLASSYLYLDCMAKELEINCCEKKKKKTPSCNQRREVFTILQNRNSKL